MTIVHRIARGAQMVAPIMTGPGAVSGYTPPDSRPIFDPDTNWLREAFFGQTTTTGKTVTVDGSVVIPAVLGALRLLTDAIGAMPANTYARQSGGGRLEAYNETSWRLLHERPNPEMAPTFLFRQLMLAVNTWGNAYIGKVFDGPDLVEVWPLRSDRVRVARRSGRKLFYVRNEIGVENPKPYTTDEVIHIPGISFDGVVGISPIEAAAEALGAGLALSEYHNRFFSTGAVPRVVLKHSDELSPRAAANLKRDWKAKYGGLRRSNEVAVLEEGMDMQVISFPLAQLQFVELMQWGLTDIANVFRVPPSKIGGKTGDSMHYTTAESEGIDFLTYSMLGWVTLFEQCLMLDQDLFPPRRADRASTYLEFDVSRLLRADSKTEAEVDRIATGGRAWAKPSEIRSRRNMPADDSLDALPPTPGGPGGGFDRPAAAAVDAAVADSGGSGA